MAGVGYLVLVLSGTIPKWDENETNKIKDTVLIRRTPERRLTRS
jgi:hypothetical protein